MTARAGLRVRAAWHEMRCGQCRVTWRSWARRIAGKPAGYSPAAPAPIVAEMTILRFGPGDRLILHTNLALLTPAQAENIERLTRARLDLGPDVRVLVVPSGWRAETLRAGDATDG